MKNLKIVLVLVVSLLVSFDAFAASEDKKVLERESIEMNSVELEVYTDSDEGTFEEDLGINITSEDIEDALKDAYASR